MRVFDYFLCAALMVALNARAALQEPVVGSSSEYSAGPYSFRASQISFRGRNLGYIEAGFKPQQFSKYWVYQACTLSREEPGMGSCGQWKLLDATSGNVTPIQLPQFDSFWSDPAFMWPYVAYVKMGKQYDSSWERDVSCVVFNYQTGAIVRRERKRISASYFETDFPGLFPPPRVTQSHGKVSFEFSLATGGSSETLCKVLVP